jgi:gliding motility-associated-like protein
MRTGHSIILLLSVQIGCLFFCPGKTAAQDVTTSTNVFITDGLLVSVDGSIRNSGFILNNGSITLSGDWLNTAVYQGTGAILLEGSDQQIHNNHQSIYALSIGGGGTKTLTGLLTIDRLLTLKEGILMISDEDTLKLLAPVTIEGGSALSYVDGALISYGIGYKFFPVGKNEKYHPVELLDVTGASVGIEVEVQENLPAIQVSVPSTPMADVYWTRKIVRGTYEGSPITVRYNVREGIEPDHLVMLESESLTQEFVTRETTLDQTNDLDLITSRNTPEGKIIVLAELAGEPPREYYFSTTLSPHASNPENRSIRIFGDNLTAHNFRFQVFNRWGQPIYESSSAADMTSQGWDGKHNGNILPSGVYPYSLTYIDTTGKAVKRTGFITIVQ